VLDIERVTRHDVIAFTTAVAERGPEEAAGERERVRYTAEALGMPLGTVKNLLHRARKRLTELARPAEVKAA